MTWTGPQSTWAMRDYPVLVAAARRLEDAPGTRFRGSDLAAEAGLDRTDVIRALVALHSGRYLLTNPMGAQNASPEVIVIGLTERGRRMVGLWPAGDGADVLTDALRQAADRVSDDADRSALRTAAGLLRTVTPHVITDVMVAVMTSQAGSPRPGDPGSRRW
jgi:hypothetical protein